MVLSSAALSVLRHLGQTVGSTGLGRHPVPDCRDSDRVLSIDPVSEDPQRAMRGLLPVLTGTGCSGACLPFSSAEPLRRS
jgi:hypothetical protein